jgi:hypothetical protein
MYLLGMSRLPFKALPPIKNLGATVRGDKTPINIGRLTVFYEDGTVKSFFEGNPQSEGSATPREVTQEELNRIVPFLRQKMRDKVFEDMIDERMASIDPD